MKTVAEEWSQRAEPWIVAWSAHTVALWRSSFISSPSPLTLACSTVTVGPRHPKRWWTESVAEAFISGALITSVARKMEAVRYLEADRTRFRVGLGARK